jgi:aminopeptidase N
VFGFELINFYNILIQSSTEGEYTWVKTIYQDTPLMSTYLLAVIISDYECQKGYANPSNDRNITIQVCARSNAQDELGLALEASIGMSVFFEKYYGIEYPLSKLGMILINLLL